MDKIANTCGHYDAYRKGAAFDRELELYVPTPNINNNENNMCFNSDANELVRNIEADLVYIDPPYNSRQYCDAYHLLENVARWEKPDVHGVARKMDRTALKSDYCTIKATEAFEDLIDNIKAKYILLSYNNMAEKGNERSNAKISDDDILRILNKKGTVKVFSKSYKASTMDEAKQIVEDERYRRLAHLIDTRFTDDVLIKLLDMFENRDDEGISNIVTDNADIPTIFEYILGIIWYKTSERQGRILDYMKLSLEADLLPKTHAGGGEADIVYEYSATEVYPEHTLLLEATLADGSNQRRMEMEPVSRHLGQHMLRTGNLNSYCIFATTYLDINVISDFRSRKYTPYFDTRDYSRSVDGMKIIPLQTLELKSIIQNKLTYKTLYSILEEAYNSRELIPDWYNKCIAQEVLKKYRYSQSVEEMLVVAENQEM